MKPTTELIEAACEITGCTVEQYHSKTRKTEAALARMMVAYYRRVFNMETYEAIRPKKHDMAIYRVRTIKDILALPTDPRRERVMRFLAICSTDQPITAKADGATLTLSGASKSAVYVSGLLTVIDFTGSVTRVQKERMTVDEMISIMNR